MSIGLWHASMINLIQRKFKVQVLSIFVVF